MSFSVEHRRTGVGKQKKTFKNLERNSATRLQKVVTPVVENTKPSHVIFEYAGNYRCPIYGDASVKFEDERLMWFLHSNKSLVAELEHLHYNTFLLRWLVDSLTQ